MRRFDRTIQVFEGKHCKVEVEGKTVTRLLNPDQLERYQRGFDNARRLRQLIAELEALSLHAAEQAEGWVPNP